MKKSNETNRIRVARGPGRPRKPHRVGIFKLSEDLADWLDAAAAEHGWKKTAIVEEGLRLVRAQWAVSPPLRR